MSSKIHPEAVSPERVAELTHAGPSGALSVTPVLDGPLHVKGNLELVSGDGHIIDRVTEAWLCRCGGSSKKPYCDGTHKKNGFKAEGRAPVRK